MVTVLLVIAFSVYYVGMMFFIYQTLIWGWGGGNLD